MATELKLTRGEALLVERRRRGLNQVLAAADWKVHPDKYREWEADRREDVPEVNVGELKPHEVCYLKRRRSGKTQREIAAALGVTRLWVITMEDGKAPVDRLVEYWGANA